MNETVEEIAPIVTTTECPRCHGTGQILYVDPDSIEFVGTGRRPQAAGPLRHGEPSRYSRGCRCEACRAAWTAYRAARERRG